jgi:hypothetical protein
MKKQFFLASLGLLAIHVMAGIALATSGPAMTSNRCRAHND